MQKILEEQIRRHREICPTGFDIIIDDKPHSYESQRYLIQHYLALLIVDGIAVIEDIIQKLKQYVPTEGYAIEVIDPRAQKNHWDDVLFVIKKTGELL